MVASTGISKKVQQYCLHTLRELESTHRPLSSSFLGLCLESYKVLLRGLWINPWSPSFSEAWCSAEQFRGRAAGFRGFRSGLGLWALRLGFRV